MTTLSNQRVSDWSTVSLTGRMLGALYYYSPGLNGASELTEGVAELLEALKDPSWVEDWPCGQIDALQTVAELMQKGLMQEEKESLEEAYQRLFIGPNVLPAPPWGSVYLDRESVLFGESTLALRQWQRSLGIETQQQNLEPEDHIGLLLLLAAWLAEQQSAELVTLLSTHLLSWSSRFLTLLAQQAEHPFYQGLALLTDITLDNWQQRFDIKINEKELFR